MTEKDLQSKLLELDLPTSNEDEKRQLFVLRSSADGLKIKESVIIPLSSGGVRQTIMKYSISLPEVQLIPLWTAPGASPKALNMKFRNNANTGNDVSASLSSLKDLYKFQQAITGYYVAFDKCNIKTECFYQQYLSHTRVLERGRIQIWVPKRIDETPLVQMTAAQAPADPSDEVTVEETVPSSVQSISLRDAEPSVMNGGLPALRRASTFTAPHGVGHIHHRPRQPLLVLFLERERKPGDQDEASLSFLAVEVNDDTFVNRLSCGCQEARRTCRDSSVEQMGGKLRAVRYAARIGLDAWNLAAAGQWQQDLDRPDRTIEKGLKWVNISFQSHEDRKSFAGSVCSCSGNEHKPSVACNKKHRGRFGEVKQSYLQKLAEYDNRHNLPHVSND